jgi:hypothetical protein
LSNLRFKDEVIKTNTELVSDAVHVYYYEFIDTSYSATYPEAELDWLNAGWYYEYGVNGSGQSVPVLIPAAELDWGTLQDKYYYIETVEFDGEICNKWRKIEPYVDGSSMTWSATASQYIYTNDIVSVQVESNSHLNNFGLAEKTLNTAGKWCVSDIELRISSAELAKLKPEYLRSGAEVFGISGNYGAASGTITIPAGIYEVRPNYTEADDFTMDFNFYCKAQQSSSFELSEGYIRVYIGDGNYMNIPENYDNLRNYLIYVPQDQAVSHWAGRLFYKVCAPYVSCKDEHGIEVTPEALVEYIMRSSDSFCPNCGSSDYGEYEGEMRCNHCYYPYSGYCAEHGYYNTSYEYVCPSCYPHQCMCDSRFATESEMEEHQVQSHNWYYCSDCGHARPYEGDGSDYSWVEHTCRGTTCNQANYVWYEDAWSDNWSEFEQAYYQYTCEGCSCNFRAGGQYDTLDSCPCCGGTVYYSSDPDEPGSGGGDYMACPWCGQYAYDGNVCNNCDYGKDEPGDGYSCPQCGSSIDWEEYPYTGTCTEGHDVNLHDPEYCSHTKVNWYCSNAECGSSGTYCSGWSLDSDVEDSVGNGYCPNCHGPYVY